MHDIQEAMSGGNPAWQVFQNDVASAWQFIPLSHAALTWIVWGLGALAVWLFARWRWRYWKKQGEVILEPGKFGPKPGFVARVVRYIIGRIAVRFMMGPVTIIGRRNLWYNGRVITFGPHISYLHDTPLAVRYMKLRPMRFFIAREEAIGNRERVAKLKGFGGFVARLFEALRTPLLAYAGGIVVDRGNPEATKAAFNSGVAAMDVDGDCSFVLFPGGMVREQAKPVPANYFTGAVRLLRTIVPQKQRRRFPLFRKPRSPALMPYGVWLDFDWNHATLFHKFVVKVLGFKNFRRVKRDKYIVGTYVAFGTPQDSRMLHPDARIATRRMARRVDILQQHCIHRMKKKFGEDPGAEPPPEDSADKEIVHA